MSVPIRGSRLPGGDQRSPRVAIQHTAVVDGCFQSSATRASGLEKRETARNTKHGAGTEDIKEAMSPQGLGQTERAAPHAFSGRLIRVASHASPHMPALWPGQPGSIEV